VTQCSPAQVRRHFGRTHCLRLEGWKNKPSQQLAACILLAWLTLRPEDVSSTLVRNAWERLADSRRHLIDDGSPLFFCLILRSCSLQPPAHAGSSLADFSTLKKEAIRSSETSGYTRSTRHHIPEDGILHSHRHENHKSYIE
jgi:hypothetical protein